MIHEEPFEGLPEGEGVHRWAHENLAAFLAGGLSVRERTFLEAHVHACAACFEGFSEARAADLEVMRVVGGAGGVGGGAGLEERVAKGFREQTMKRQTVRWAGMGVAAAVGLAATGVLANRLVRMDQLNNPVTVALAEDVPGMPAWVRGEVSPYREQVTAASSKGRTALTSREGTDYWKQAIDSSAPMMADLQAVGRADGEKEGGIRDENTADNVRRRSYTTYSFDRGLDPNPAPGGPGKVGGGLPDALREVQGEQNGRFLVGAGVSTSSGLFGQVPVDQNPATGTGMIKNGSGTLANNESKAVGGMSVANGGALALGGSVGAINLNGGNISGRGGFGTGGTTGGSTGGRGGGRATDNYFNSTVAAGGINGAAAVPSSGTEVLRSGGWVSGGSTPTNFGDTKFNYGVRIENAADVNKELYGKDTYARENLQRIKQTNVSDVNGKAAPTIGDLPALGVGFRQVAQAEVPMTPPAATQPSAAPNGGGGVADVTAAERKVIRNGTVEFEVRSFDDASNTITSVVKEEGGFVSSTSSDRLANGKIRGSVVVRVPPEHLDRMLLKIRGIGELKNQQISASDVTKQYTDIESELRALRAMEGRLIDLIKNGKGEVKDLVEAEKQLGEYRVRIEKLEGEIRYYNNLVGMATLTITAYEKDIQKAAAATEQETATIDLQTEEIEAQYAAARKVVDDAKGRVVDSGVRKGENDQTTAFLIADVPADKAEGVMAGLRSLGTVTRFERARKQTVSGGTDGSAGAGLAVEQKDSRVSLTLSNLASVPPRETMSVSVAAADVGAAYQAVLATVRDVAAGAGATTRPAGVMSAVGRVASSQLTGNRAEDLVGSIQAEVRAEQVEKVLGVLRGQGIVTSSTVSQSASGATTGAKEGMSIMIVSAATVPPRETMVLSVAAADVGAVYEAVLAAMHEGGGNGVGAAAGRVVSSQLAGKTAEEMTGTIQAEVKSEALAKVLGLLRDQGAVLAQSVTQNSNGAGTATKEGLSITLISAATIAPRRTTTLGVEVGDVGRGLERIRAALPAGAKVLEDLAGKEGSGRTTGRITVDVPVGDAMRVLSAVRDLNGEERVNSVQSNPDAPDTKFAKERISITLSSRATIVGEDKGVWVTVRAALGSALAALSWSLYLVLTGVLFLLPWAVVLWGLRKVWRRRRVVAA